MKLKDQSLLSCWPDGFSRYYSISNVLRIVYGDKKTIEILDVGGDSQWMTKFLDNESLLYDLNILDTRKPDFKNKNPHVHYTQGDFFKIKPTDFPAEAVINTDVLEHIPKDLKIPFVDQCIEIASSLVILSAPQDDDEVTKAEEQINDYYNKFSGKPQRWLKEHFEFGKPNPDKIEAAIKKHGLPFICINSNNLENWLVTFSLNFINSELIGLEGMDELNRYYNENIHSNGDYTGKPYRKIFVVFKDKKLYEQKITELEKFFAPNSSNKMEYLEKVNDTLVANFKRLKDSHKSFDTERKLLEKNLKQTQDAYVNAQNELDAIKASRAYRYTKKARSIVKHTKA